MTSVESTKPETFEDLKTEILKLETGASKYHGTSAELNELILFVIYSTLGINTDRVYGVKDLPVL